MSQRTVLFDPIKSHLNDITDGVIHVDHECLFICAEKNRTPVGRRHHPTNRYFDNIGIHTEAKEPMSGPGASRSILMFKPPKTNAGFTRRQNNVFFVYDDDPPTFQGRGFDVGFHH